MEIINKNKLFFNLENVVKKEPITADIFLTDFCNLDCRYCRFKKTKGYMFIETFIKVVDRLINLGVKSVILTGGGEPLLHPDITEIVKYLNKKNMSYGVNTNLTKYVDLSGAKWIKVGLDAYNPENYLLKKGVNYFDKVLGNVNRLIKNNSSAVVTLQFVIMRPGEILYIYEKFKDHNVDNLVFRPVESKKKFYTNDNLAEINNDLNNLIHKKNKKTLINFKWDMLDNSFPSCYANWSVLTINHNAEVLYCCHKQNEVVGSVFDRDILEKKQNFRSDMGNCEKPCRLSGSNLLYEKIFNKKAKHKNFV